MQHWFEVRQGLIWNIFYGLVLSYGFCKISKKGEGDEEGEGEGEGECQGEGVGEGEEEEEEEEEEDEEDEELEKKKNLHFLKVNFDHAKWTLSDWQAANTN